MPQLLQTISGVDPFQETIKQLITQKASIAARMIDDKKVTDHHAIIPTDKTPNVAALSVEERNVYQLVIKRFVAAFLPECEKHHTEIITSCDQYRFKTTGTVIKVPGWRQLYIDEVPSKKDKKETQLPIVNQGDEIGYEKVTVKKGQTKAPPLFTEASILAAMETAGKLVEDDEMRQAMKECGLGTPATRAQILEKLIHVKYIEREKNKLIPTEKGEYIIDCIQDDILVSPQLTGDWEKQLNQIAQGSVNRTDYMNHIKQFTKDIIEKVNDSTVATLRADQEVLGDCPLCNKGKIVETPKAYGCSQWKATECKFVIWKDMARKSISSSQVKTLLKSGKTKVIKGFKNKQGNPFNAALKLQEGTVVFDFEKESIGKCPVCDAGQMIETAKAYSCDQWRETGCKAAIWKEIAKRKITKDEAKSLIKDGKLENLEGFTSRAGKPFSVTLVFKNGKVEFL